MALAANALVTLEDAREYLDVKGQDAALEEEINRASTLIEGHCDRPLKRTTALDPLSIRRSGTVGCVLRLRVVPLDVTKAVTVTVDGIAQTVWKEAADGEPDDKDVVVGYVQHDTFHPGVPEWTLFAPDALYRKHGWGASRVGGIAISYSGGLVTVPEDLKEATLYVLQRLWDDRTKKIADIASLSTPSGSFARPIADATLPRLARKILDDRYRYWTVG